MCKYTSMYVAFRPHLPFDENKMTASSRRLSSRFLTHCGALAFWWWLLAVCFGPVYASVCEIILRSFAFFPVLAPSLPLCRVPVFLDFCSRLPPLRPVSRKMFCEAGRGFTVGMYFVCDFFYGMAYMGTNWFSLWRVLISNTIPGQIPLLHQIILHTKHPAVWYWYTWYNQHTTNSFRKPVLVVDCHFHEEKPCFAQFLCDVACIKLRS